MLESLKAQGLDLPEIGEKRTRPGTRVRPSKLKKSESVEKESTSRDDSENKEIEEVKEGSTEPVAEPVKEVVKGKFVSYGKL